MKERGSSIKNGGVCEYLKGSIQNPIKKVNSTCNQQWAYVKLTWRGGGGDRIYLAYVCFLRRFSFNPNCENLIHENTEDCNRPLK